MNILIVDDSRAMRSIVRRILRMAGFSGHSIQEASNGAEALGLIKEKMPDLVMCDFNMPEMNGLQLLENLTQTGLRSRFGFVTSEASTELKDAAMAAGAIFVITKPFTQQVFEEVLGPVLSA
ncbi:MAG: response regulator transcription factor [Terriglobia bacterium]